MNAAAEMQGLRLKLSETDRIHCPCCRQKARDEIRRRMRLVTEKDSAVYGEPTNPKTEA